MHARRVFTGVMVVCLSLAMAGQPAEAQTRLTRIVSTSGIPHADVGDYTESQFWSSGKPRGFPDHPSWPQSINIVLRQLASERADSYLHTGDMVSGKWGVDKDRPKAGIFGPTDTLADRKRQVLRAGDLYYRQNKSWWKRNGISPSRVHFGMGDHEYGDTQHHGRPRPNQLSFVGPHRAIWHKHFVQHRGYEYRLTQGQQQRGAYATVLPGGVGLVTLDPIVKRDGRLLARIGGPQFSWLERVLADMRARSDIRYIIVQVEIPARGPNRAFHTGRQLLRNGDALWSLLRKYDVDLLLASEFHEKSTLTANGRSPVQIVHGSQLYQGRVNYLVIDVYHDRIKLVIKRMTGTRSDLGAFWAPHHHRAPGVLKMSRETTVIGTATLIDGVLVDRTGLLREGVQ